MMVTTVDPDVLQTVAKRQDDKIQIHCNADQGQNVGAALNFILFIRQVGGYYGKEYVIATLLSYESGGCHSYHSVDSPSNSVRNPFTA